MLIWILLHFTETSTGYLMYFDSYEVWLHEREGTALIMLAKLLTGMLLEYYSKQPVEN